MSSVLSFQIVPDPRWRQSIRNRDFIRSVKHSFRFCVCVFLRLKETQSTQTSKHYDILACDLWVTFPTLCILTALTRFHYFHIYFCCIFVFFQISMRHANESGAQSPLEIDTRSASVGWISFYVNFQYWILSVYNSMVVLTCNIDWELRLNLN